MISVSAPVLKNPTSELYDELMNMEWSESESDLLFKCAPDVEGGLFLRDSEATYWDEESKSLKVAGVNEVRNNHWVKNPVTGIYERALRLEAGGANVILKSCDFETGVTQWAGDVDFTIEAAASCLTGQVAYKHTNLGTLPARARVQTSGTLTGSPETFSIIVENVNALTTRFGVWDTTLSAFVAYSDFTWETGSADIISGSGTVRAHQLSASGPNGGALYRVTLTVTGTTAGNGRRWVIYPTGAGQNSLSSIIHHAQHEEAGFASAPIITDTDVATRSDDLLSFSAPDTQAMSIYTRFIYEGASSAGEGLWLFGDGFASSLGSSLFLLATPLTVAATHRTTTDTSSAVGTGSPEEGDMIEVLVHWHEDGRVQTHASKNEGPLATGGLSAPLTPGDSFSEPSLYLGRRTSTANVGHTSFLDFEVAVGTEHDMDDFRRLAV